MNAPQKKHWSINSILSAFPSVELLASPE